MAPGESAATSPGQAASVAVPHMSQPGASVSPVCKGQGNGRSGAGVPRGVSGVGDIVKGTIITFSSASGLEGTHVALAIPSGSDPSSEGSWLLQGTRREALGAFQGAGGPVALKKNKEEKLKSGHVSVNPACFKGRADSRGRPRLVAGTSPQSQAWVLRPAPTCSCPFCLHPPLVGYRDIFWGAERAQDRGSEPRISGSEPMISVSFRF